MSTWKADFTNNTEKPGIGTAVATLLDDSGVVLFVMQERIDSNSPDQLATFVQNAKAKAAFIVQKDTDQKNVGATIESMLNQ